MIILGTRRGTLIFPTSEREASTMDTEDLRDNLIRNDPNGEWYDADRETLIEGAILMGLEIQGD